MTPKKGPIGTMITLTYSGLGSSLYEGGASLQYDNHYVGAIMANWTRGVANGPVPRRRPGRPAHRRGHRRDQLRLPQHPAVADPVGDREDFTFNVTKDARPPEAADRLAGRGRADARREDDDGRRQRPRRRQGDGDAVSSTAGPVMSKVDVSANGLTPSAPVSLVWSTVVGNRVNCTGTCWSFVSVPLGTGTAGADGTLTSNVQVPDGLGGWHVDPAAAERRR